MACVVETRRLVQFDGCLQTAMCFQKEILTGNRIKARNCREQQVSTIAKPLPASSYGHFCQLVAALSVMFQGDRSYQLIVLLGKQDVSAVVYDLRARIRQYGAIYVLYPEILL